MRRSLAVLFLPQIGRFKKLTSHYIRWSGEIISSVGEILSNPVEILHGIEILQFAVFEPALGNSLGSSISYEVGFAREGSFMLLFPLYEPKTHLEGYWRRVVVATQCEEMSCLQQLHTMMSSPPFFSFSKILKGNLLCES